MAKNYISHSRWLARPLAALVLVLLAAGAATAQTTTITYTYCVHTSPRASFQPSYSR